MDICVVRFNYHSSEFGMVDYTLERGLEGILYLHQGHFREGCQIDQVDSGRERGRS